MKNAMLLALLTLCLSGCASAKKLHLTCETFWNDDQALISECEER